MTETPAAITTIRAAIALIKAPANTTVTVLWCDVDSDNTAISDQSGGR